MKVKVEYFFGAAYPHQSLHVDSEIAAGFESVAIRDLKIVATIGVGGFGRVELVSTRVLL